MRKYKYVVAFKGQYFALKGGFRAYKRFCYLSSINSHNSLISFLYTLKLNDIHYTIVTSTIEKGV